MVSEITISSQAGNDLLFARLVANEELGRLFVVQLDAVSKKQELDLRPLLGTPMTVKIVGEDAVERYFQGIVSEASQTGFVDTNESSYASYHFTLVPKPWLLMHRVDCRIFKKKSVPDIVKLLLSEIGYSDVRLSLRSTYPSREYCVQYRESTFNFISRLMEQEGIYYYFDHQASAHTMVLADGLDAHSKMKPKSALMYRPDAAGKTIDEASILAFATERSVHTSKYQLTDYDPLKPRASLLVAESISNPDQHHLVKGLDAFDFPGDHDITADGSRYAQVRLESLNALHSKFVGTSNALKLGTGALFSLTGFPRKELEQEYLVTSSTFVIEQSTHLAGNRNTPTQITKFCAIPSRQPYRSIQATPRPSIPGLQTATVCGSEDAEDIVVDKYGRVQVVFHWNKTDKPNHDVSCPVRVSTPWAGRQWGAVHIPRVGQEVVVSFLEGDPDRPLIVGSVYNADNMPPYDLPANMTQSGIKSRSHKGGAAANFNEIRFEDKMGSEELFLHAEKDMREEVEHDHFVQIDNDETETIKHDRTHTVGNDEKFTITNNRTHDVGQEDKLTVGANSTTDVNQKYKLTAGTEIQLVTGSSSITMKSDGSIEISGVQISIKGSASVKVDGQATVDVHAGASLSLKSDANAELSGGAMTSVKAPMLTLSGDAMAKLGGGITMIG